MYLELVIAIDFEANKSYPRSGVVNEPAGANSHVVISIAVRLLRKQSPGRKLTKVARAPGPFPRTLFRSLPVAGFQFFREQCFRNAFR